MEALFWALDQLRNAMKSRQQHDDRQVDFPYDEAHFPAASLLYYLSSLLLSGLAVKDLTKNDVRHW